jgi:hypothetical protein
MARQTMGTEMDAIEAIHGRRSIRDYGRRPRDKPAITWSGA